MKKIIKLASFFFQFLAFDAKSYQIKPSFFFTMVTFTVLVYKIMHFCYCLRCRRLRVLVLRRHTICFWHIRKALSFWHWVGINYQMHLSFQSEFMSQSVSNPWFWYEFHPIFQILAQGFVNRRNGVCNSSINVLLQTPLWRWDL